MLFNISAVVCAAPDDFATTVADLFHSVSPRATVVHALSAAAACELITELAIIQRQPTVLFVSAGIAGGIPQILTCISTSDFYFCRIVAVGVHPEDRPELVRLGVHSFVPADPEMLKLAVQYWATANFAG